MPLVWLTHPVLWHSSRVPSWNFTAMTPEQALLVQARWHNWYRADWDYGRTTVYFFCAAIFVFGIVNLIFQLRQRTNDDAVQRVPLYTKVVAASRSIGARQIHIPVFDYYSPPLSAVVFVAGLITFFTALTFSVRPYRWPNPAMGDSWPIATRSGWISIGIMPFLYVLGTKLNLIGMVTGVSHEKLQVYHRWSAWIMYVTSLIHTFPFIVQSIENGEMVLNWNTSVYYWTGVAALVPQTWLVFMSWGPIRNRYYETFKKLHFIASAIFIAALFVHCDFTLTSWDYFWATAALYGVSWFARTGRTFYNGLGSGATFEMLPENMVKIVIRTKVAWRPGQHFFVRFLNLGVHAASSHPFTIASLPDIVSSEKSSGNDKRIMEVYARVHGGITARLAAAAQSGTLKTSRVLLDGPYGGFEGNIKAYDRVLLLGGGSGVSFVVPLLLDLVRSSETDQSKCRKVDLVWAVRTKSGLSWFDDAISGAMKAAPAQLSIDVSYYVTDMTTTVDDGASIESEQSKVGTGGVSRNTGRPRLHAIVKEFCVEQGTVAIATCGPDSFNLDVGNAVAECELAIFGGTSACSEIYLHRETYSW
uniref:ferric-chelate reductase (NADPH) n=1 Tax=Ganoderma boninense TaxID=34458 RepID=A0A5K1JUM5_9APHY|nr:FAD-binding FR-type domain-containing protein [Ganoderma boninense]